ncbi:polynucleotide adenylyltransferase region [Nannochloropsis gaditana]|uniref:Polynucleotide adenylyltransferase region n=1 Tax=Nannochloropsis gaditana TaxID=72520 RepID=W7U1M5_9STRA|nr:polynucleotide adenylyltransferase region [Nannochloropsis gaditana]
MNDRLPKHTRSALILLAILCTVKGSPHLALQPCGALQASLAFSRPSARDASTSSLPSPCAHRTRQRRYGEQPAFPVWMQSSDSLEISEAAQQHKVARIRKFSPGPLVPAADGESATPQAINVVLTHAIADFDSLAAAVGLAKYWSHQNPETEAYVCMPQGAHPSVEAFLALHSVLFPLRALGTIDPSHVHKLGVVDASTKDRLGAGQGLLASAREVHVFDHHAMKVPDIEATALNLEDVGSVTTMVVERLREADVNITDAEATLLAIGIHADTGSMTYDCTTVRDVEALAWVMRHGARQPVIAEFCHQRLTQHQQHFLSESFVRLNTTLYEGVNIGTVVVDCQEYVGGLARVAQHVLELTSCDVLVWGGLYVQGSGRKQTRRLVLIGRARSGVNFVNFDEIFKPLGGGGHMKAAAANIKFGEDPAFAQGAEEAVMKDVVESLKRQVASRQDFKLAKDIMSSPVLTVYRDTTMAQVAQLLRKYNIHAVPVVGANEARAPQRPEEAAIVRGVVTDVEVLKAFKAGKMESPVSGWLLKKIGAVDVDTPVDQVKRVMAENDGRDVLVMDRQGKLVGLISRTDILQSYQFYSVGSFAPKEAFCGKELATAVLQAGEVVKVEHCTTCSAHTDCRDFR